MSQIGYMIMGVGVGAYRAGVLHFFTHAFFKAQLFLGAGIIIHNARQRTGRAQDGRPAQAMPFAFCAMLIGTLAIMRLPVLQRVLQKDAVLYGRSSARHPVLYGGRRADRRHHRVLHVPHALRRVLRRPYRGNVDPSELGAAASRTRRHAPGSRTHAAKKKITATRTRRPG
jgi:hypothetical protein